MATKATRTYRSIPYAKIATMFGEGKTYEAIAKAIKRFDPKASDPTKPTRAIVSRMLNDGWKDEDGKTHILKPREGMRAIGVGKKAAAKTNKTKKVAKVTHGKPGRKGSPIVVNLTDGGKFVRVKIAGHQTKGPVEKVQPQLIGVLDALGFAVVQKVTPTPAPAETAPETEPASVVEVAAAEIPSAESAA